MGLAPTTGPSVATSDAGRLRSTADMVAVYGSTLGMSIGSSPTWEACLLELTERHIRQVGGHRRDAARAGPVPECRLR